MEDGKKRKTITEWGEALLKKIMCIKEMAKNLIGHFQNHIQIIIREYNNFSR